MTDERRRIDLVVVPWDEVAPRTQQGYAEVMRRGAVIADELVGLPVIDAHLGTAVGVVESARDTGSAMVATLALSAIARADELHTLAADGALGASLGFDSVPDGHTFDGSLLTRTRVSPREVSLTPLPAYRGARVLQTREYLPMTATPPAATPAATVPDPAPAPAAAPEHVRAAAPTPAPGNLPTVVEYASTADVEAIRARLDAFGSPNPGGANLAAAHPLSGFTGPGAFMRAAYRGELSPEQARAWVNQTTPNNPGVVPPSWLTDIKGIIDHPRHLINGTGGPASPGDTGLAVNWPFFDGDLSALIGAQAAQKTEVTSVRVDLKKGEADLVTYAGGSDLAYQVIERSSPSYLDAYMRIMAAAYGVVTERAYAAALAAVRAGVATDGADLYAAIIEATAVVGDATGAAPSVIGIGSGAWAEVAGAVDSDGRPVYPPLAPQNAPGAPVGAGAIGGISIAGIPAYRVPGLPARSVVITNGTAARWMEDGPRTLSADDVPLLGRDVAVYGYAAPALFTPAGVVHLALNAAAPVTRTAK
jgi:hypothetical protein